MLRRAGFEQSRIKQESGLYFAVSRCEIDFIAPAALDDALDVHTYIDGIGGASIHAEQVVRRGGDALATLRLRIACLGPDGRPARMPVELRSALGSLGAADNAEMRS
jgi:acyl-CoA thioester hydrolase